MGKSLGIAAFVFLLLSFPIPVLGNYVTFLALLLACGSAACGEGMWTVTVDVIAWVKLFLLSPTWHIAMFGAAYMQGMQTAVTSLGQGDAATQRDMTGGVSAVAQANQMTLLMTLAFLIGPPAILLVVRVARRLAPARRVPPTSGGGIPSTGSEPSAPPAVGGDAALFLFAAQIGAAGVAALGLLYSAVRA